MENNLTQQESSYPSFAQKQQNRLRSSFCITSHRNPEPLLITCTPQEDILKQNILKEERPHHSTSSSYSSELEWILKKARLLSLKSSLSREDLRRLSLRQFYSSRSYLLMSKFAKFLHNTADTSVYIYHLAYNFFYTKVINRNTN